MKKVSVIIPVFNCEKYIEKCILSVINQSYENIEILIINDGSTDDTKKILEKFSEKCIIHNNKNNGIGYSRNYGIKKATGDYITFLDSDDYYETNYISKLVSYAEKYKLDMVVCDIKKVNENYELIGYERTNNFNNTSLKNNPNLLLDISLGPVNKLYSKSLFGDKNNRFLENSKYEDAYLLPMLIAQASKIGKINNVYYNYLIRANSQTTTMNSSVFDIINVFEKVNKYLKTLSYYEEIKIHIEYLNIRTMFRYTLQQKNQKDKHIANNFIDKAFEFLDSNFLYWRKNKIYVQNRSKLKRLIETNKTLSKLYIKIN